MLVSCLTFAYYFHLNGEFFSNFENVGVCVSSIISGLPRILIASLLGPCDCIRPIPLMHGRVWVIWTLYFACSRVLWFRRRTADAGYWNKLNRYFLNTSIDSRRLPFLCTPYASAARRTCATFNQDQDQFIVLVKKSARDWLLVGFDFCCRSTICM